MENKKASRKTNSNIYRSLYQNKNSQMIVLMGIVLAISVFMISSLTAEITNLDTVISTERSTSLQSEFTCIKETFALSLNYNLAEKITMQGNELRFYGNIDNITKAFEQTRDEYIVLELQHDILFEAELNDPSYWYEHPGGTDYVYHVNVTLSLEDRDTRIAENVLYSIVCRPLITP